MCHDFSFLLSLGNSINEMRVYSSPMGYEDGHPLSSLYIFSFACSIVRVEKCHDLQDKMFTGFNRHLSIKDVKFQMRRP